MSYLLPSTARIRRIGFQLAETFWLVPSVMVLLGVLGADAAVDFDRAGRMDDWLRDHPDLYNGGGTEARTVLGTIASSTIGVAGTLFSITIAALSLAAGQMGPRLLRGFTRDRSNQLTLGAFLGTFAYTMVVLRSLKIEEPDPFVPYLAINVAILLALVCVLALVYFVGHMARRVNVDSVIDLVGADMRASFERLTCAEKGAAPPHEDFWQGAGIVTDSRRGYLHQIDEARLARWAADNGAALRLFVRPGDYVFPGAPVGMVQPPVEGAEAAIRAATALGTRRNSSADLKYEVRQLVEVAVRCLSPGVNDPNTALSALDQLGTVLCELAPRHLPTGVTVQGGRPALVMPGIDYDALTDTMFHLIRQNACRLPSLPIRMLDILATVATVERDPERLRSLWRHADLILADSAREPMNPNDIAEIRARHARFLAVWRGGTAAVQSTIASSADS